MIKYEIETVCINGVDMYRTCGQLFLKKTEAIRYLGRRSKRCRHLMADNAECHAYEWSMYRDANEYRTTPANYDALSFGYLEVADDDFAKMLKDGNVRGILL